MASRNNSEANSSKAEATDYHTNGTRTEDSTSTGCPIESLSTEVLQMIMERALPPKSLVAPFYPLEHHRGLPSWRFSRDAWLKSLDTKKALSLVCKVWHVASLRYLYEDVVIKSFTQAKSLLSIIRKNDGLVDVSRIVKSLTFSGSSLMSHSGSHERKIFVKLRKSCTSVTSVSLILKDRGIVDDMSKLSSGLLLTSFTLFAKDSLTQRDTCTGYLIAGIQSASKTLTHLHLYEKLLPKLSIGHSDESGRTDFNDNVIFEVLEELEVTAPIQDTSSIREIPEGWSFPKLSRLTWHTMNPGFFRDNGTFERIVDASGCGIKYLHLDFDIYASIRSFHICESISRAIKICRSLQHLVVPVNHKFLRLDGPNLQWIDVWDDVAVPNDNSALRLRGGAFTKQVARKSTGGVAPRHAPVEQKHDLRSLRGVRQLDQKLQYLCRLPLDIPPDSVLDEHEEFCVEYEDVRIKHEVGRLISLGKRLAEEEVISE